MIKNKQFPMTTITQAIEKARIELLQKGTVIPSPHGGNRRVLYGYVLEIDEFTEERYPYWNKEEDEWYQNIFVRKETTKPPEEKQGQLIFPYTYSHRARYHDNGLGYLGAILNQRNSLGLRSILIKDILEELGSIAHSVHIENVLALLSTQERINEYQRHANYFRSGSIKQAIKATRVDLLEQAIQELQHDPNSSRATTGSLIYQHLDFALGKAGGIPPYQNYQLFIEQGKLISIHQHRSLDINGGVQLDFNHDIDWGMHASQKLGIPLGRIIIIANNLHAYEGDKHLDKKTTIKDWLLKVTYGYDTTQTSPQEIIQKYQKQIQQVMRTQQ